MQRADDQQTAYRTFVLLPARAVLKSSAFSFFKRSYSSIHSESERLRLEPELFCPASSPPRRIESKSSRRLWLNAPCAPFGQLLIDGFDREAHTFLFRAALCHAPQGQRCWRLLLSEVRFDGQFQHGHILQVHPVVLHFAGGTCRTEIPPLANNLSLRSAVRWRPPKREFLRSLDGGFLKMKLDAAVGNRVIKDEPNPLFPWSRGTPPL